MRRSRTDRGATAVEFALVSIPLLTLLFGFVQYGFYFWAMQGGSDIARSAARLAAVGTPATCSAFRSDIRAQIDDLAGSGSTATIRRTYTQANPAEVSIGDTVKVVVEFNSVDLHFPFVPFIHDGRVRSEADARVDYVPSRTGDVLMIRVRTAAGAEREQAAVAVMTAILVVVLFSISALVVDLGNSWARARAVQKQVDVTAIGAGWKLPMTTANRNQILDTVAGYLNDPVNAVGGQGAITRDQLDNGVLDRRRGLVQERRPDRVQRQLHGDGSGGSARPRRVRVRQRPPRWRHLRGRGATHRDRAGALGAAAEVEDAAVLAAQRVRLRPYRGRHDPARRTVPVADLDQHLDADADPLRRTVPPRLLDRPLRVRGHLARLLRHHDDLRVLGLRCGQPVQEGHVARVRARREHLRRLRCRAPRQRGRPGLPGRVRGSVRRPVTGRCTRSRRRTTAVRCTPRRTW